jgi:isomaltose glucohydrolase
MALVGSVRAEADTAPSFERLVAGSVRTLLDFQSESGAFVASPDFAQYHYCWLRDASFVAHALDRVGESEAAMRYHRWVANAIERIAPTLALAVERTRARQPIDADEMPPARFSLTGATVSDDWPNFQIDGYGTWLWSLRAHLDRTPSEDLHSRVLPAVAQTAPYLAALALSPCFDVWEEDGGSTHMSTFACVYGGLTAAAQLLGDERYGERALEVRDEVLRRGRARGFFPKSSANDDVDASSLWLCEPFGVVDGHEPLFTATAERIGETLELEGGIRRYADDTFYGGGAWPVLSASLGWNCIAAGDRRGARRHLEWIAAQFDEDANLGEQFGGERRDPAHHEEWVERWGPPARRLLWSHAMFVILANVFSESSLSPQTDRGVGRDHNERRT